MRTVLLLLVLAVMSPIAGMSAPKLSKKQSTHLQCHPAGDGSGCLVCNTHEGPIYVCPQ